MVLTKIRARGVHGYIGSLCRAIALGYAKQELLDALDLGGKKLRAGHGERSDFFFFTEDVPIFAGNVLAVNSLVADCSLPTLSL